MNLLPCSHLLVTMSHQGGYEYNASAENDVIAVDMVNSCDAYASCPDEHVTLVCAHRSNSPYPFVR